LRWTRTRGQATGASITASLGARASVDASAALGSLGQAGVRAVVERVQSNNRDYTVVDFAIAAGKLEEQQVLAELQFDLADPDGRAAYDEAVRGNFIRAQALGAARAPGVPLGRLASTLTDRLSFSATFRAFKVLNVSASAATTTIHAVVDDLDGR